ncbi:MAG: GIY-YIG nuclease family protein [Lachnospiraceae bacterium]|nr:GIY-YIG nuclease family protein [Lachnospiraceae bacterium]
MIKKEITFENKKLSELVDYLDIYVKHEIENDNNLKPEEKSIILNYPVVYIHTWKASGKLHVYVGETINLVRRTKEHVDNEKENSWQENWKNGQNHLSFYFSASCMNKSLALDIEDSLIAIFSFLKEKNNLCISNGRNNQQLGYSNKNKRDELLGEIWSAINNKLLNFPTCKSGINA